MNFHVSIRGHLLIIGVYRVFIFVMFSFLFYFYIKLLPNEGYFNAAHAKYGLSLLNYIILYTFVDATIIAADINRKIASEKCSTSFVCIIRK